MKKRLFAMVLAVVMVLAVMPTLASAASITENDVETKLEAAKGIWKHGDTFGDRAEDKAYKNNQCLGFVAVLFKYIFNASFPISTYPNARFKNGTSGLENLTEIGHLEGTNYTSSSLTSLLQQAKPGDVLVVHKTKAQGNYGHVMMIRRVKSGGSALEVHDANWACNNKNTIKIREYKADAIQRDYSGAVTLYRYVDYADGSTTPAKTTITFSGLSVPSSLTIGKDGTLDGYITATNSKINSVTAEVINASTGSVALKSTSAGNFSVYSYGPLSNSKLNTELNLGKLAAGTYYVRYTAGTQDGTSASKETGRFNVNPISCNGNHTRGGYLGSADTHPHWVYWKCAICGERYTEWGVETKDTCEICNPQPDCSNGHTWGEWETVEKADCENDGKQRRICSVCGEREEERIAAPGHDYRLTNSTATEETYTCSRCGGSYKKPIGSGGSEINGGGSCQHQWSDWNVYEYCDMEGWKSRYCKKCGEREEQPLPATGHDWRLDSDGYYRCTRCLKTNYERGKVGTDQGDDQMYFPDWNEIEHKNAVEVCTDLEIIRGLPNGYFDPERNIDRASWAKMVFCITTGRVSEGDYASEYVDMYCNLTDIQGCWAEGFIKYLTVADVVSGNGSGKYQPWSSVTVVEAAKTMLTTLGYDAQDRGYVNNVAWDTNIMADARRIGLMDGIDQQPKDELNRDNAAQMIYNALRCNTQCFFNGSYTEGDTLLRSVFHIGAIVFD